MRIPEPLLPYVAAGVIEETDAVAADVLVDIARRDAARSGGQPTAPSPVAWLPRPVEQAESVPSWVPERLRAVVSAWLAPTSTIPLRSLGSSRSK